jgi:hypothetical protein
MRRQLRRVAVGVIAAVIAASAACGDDQPDERGTDKPRPSRKAFCDRVAAYDDKADFSDTATKRLYEQLLPVAPSQIKGDVRVLLDALEGGVLGDERTAAAGDRFAAYVEQGCEISLVPEAP